MTVARWFWLWFSFSFLGYLLEKLFARLTRAEKQNRKCFILLLLCPVYGFSVMAVLALPVHWQRGGRLLLASALLPCAVEFILHWYYERFFAVRYWDYRGQPLQWRGRVCLPFALAWTVLTPVAVRWIAPALAAAAAAVPPAVTFLCWLLLAADWFWSRYLLLCWGDTERLTFRALCRRKARDA